MISTFLVKTTLLSFGIKINSIAFDVENERIDVDYSRAGRDFSKTATFEEIEQFFTSDSKAPAAPAEQKKRSTGIV